MSIVSLEKDLDNLSVILIAEFDAPIEQVWELWADPRKLERWWGPPGYPATVEKHDLVEGGEAFYAMTGPDGDKSYGWWRVKSVDPPRSLEFVDGFANPDGTPNADLPNSEVQVRLTERDGSTRMQLRFIFGSREQMEEYERLGAFEGFRASVGQMDALL